VQFSVRLSEWVYCNIGTKVCVIKTALEKDLGRSLPYTFLYRSLLYNGHMSKREKRLRKIQQNPKNNPKNLSYYMSLRYRIELIPEEDGWSAILPELPGCVGAGDTIEEVLELLEDAKQGWFVSSLKHGDTIPEPAELMQPIA
jgi:predicted RNase H-like HicB family nuclease